MITLASLIKRGGLLIEAAHDFDHRVQAAVMRKRAAASKSMMANRSDGHGSTSTAKKKPVAKPTATSAQTHNRPAPPPDPTHSGKGLIGRKKFLSFYHSYDANKPGHYDYLQKHYKRVALIKSKANAIAARNKPNSPPRPTGSALSALQNKHIPASSNASSADNTQPQNAGQQNNRRSRLSTAVKLYAGAHLLNRFNHYRAT